MMFPKGFIWGSASAAYQTEGGWDADGKGPNIWDEFSHVPGNIRNDDNGDIAADAYHRYAEDVQILKTLGLQAYRFSVNWARVLPEGSGKVNPAGLTYYDRLVDLLLENGITPYMTLYHWDLPSALNKSGGWLSRSTAVAFAEYAGLLAAHFDGRVRHTITINEPQIVLKLGYGDGIHAPGYRLTNPEQCLVMHHLLVAHGLAVRAIREKSSGPVQIGLSSTGELCYPSEDTPENRTAAYRQSFTLTENNWSFSHNLFLDAACLGHYPENAPDWVKAFAETVPATDWAIITQKQDFLGLNVYNGHEVNAEGQYVARYTGYPRTAIKWPVTPDVLHYGPLWLYQRYGLAILVTENGQSCNDRIFLDGAVHDPDRIDFLHRYLLALGKAAEEGVPLQGYFHWSLTDNFEWHQGYDERFGLVYIDYRNCDRILKDSARWYAEVVRTNGASLFSA